MAPPAMQKSSASTDSKSTSQQLPPLDENLVAGRTKLKDYLLTQDIQADKIDEFLETIDGTKTREPIYGNATKGDYNLGLEAYKTVEERQNKKMDEAIGRAIAEATDKAIKDQTKPALPSTQEKSAATQTELVIPPVKIITAEGPTSRVEFHRANQCGNLDTIPRDLRLNSDGSLQMRFVEANGKSVWLTPKDHTTGINCTCLYLNDGKVYDASGKEVKQFQWGGNVTPAEFAIKYLDNVEEGKISGIKNGYLKDMRHNGSQVVFTKGLPPSLTEISTKTTAEPEQALAQRVNQYRDLLIEAKRAVPHADKQSQAWDEFITRRLKMLEEFASKGSLDQTDRTKLQQLMEKDFTRAGKQTSVADFVDWSKKSSNNGNISVTQNQQGTYNVELPNTSFDSTWRVEVSGTDVKQITTSRTQTGSLYKINVDSPEVTFKAVQYGNYRDPSTGCYYYGVINSKSVTLRPSKISESQISDTIDKLKTLID